jgi:hypothetical protein
LARPGPFSRVSSILIFIAIQRTAVSKQAARITCLDHKPIQLCSVPNQPLCGSLSEHVELSTYDDSVKMFFPETSSGVTATDQIFDFSHGDHPAAFISDEVSINPDTVYSPPAPAPQTVEPAILLSSSAEESFKFMPVPRQNSSTNFSDADVADLLPVPSLPCLLQQPEGADSKGHLANSCSFSSVPRQNSGSFGQVYASLGNEQEEEQRVPDAKPQESSYTPDPNLLEILLTRMHNAAVFNVPGSNQVVCPFFVDGDGIFPIGCPIPTTNNIKSSTILPDGTTLAHAGRAMINNFSNIQQHLSNRFVCHGDQSQACTLNAPVPYPTSNNNAVHPEVKSALAGVPVSTSTSVAALNHILHTNEPSFIDNVPSKLPGGGHNGIGNSGNYSPSRGTSPHPGTRDDGTVATRLSRRQMKQKSNNHHQQEHHEEEQQCPADSAGTAGTNGTGSRVSHSSLYYSDGESSQGILSSEKINPDEITFEELSKMFIYNQNEAAEKVGIGSTTLKKICRRLGLSRWPSRHLKSLIKLRDTLTTDPEVIAKFSEEERRRALTEIENSLHGRAVTKSLRDFRQKVFKNTHTLRTKSGGVKKKR